MINKDFVQFDRRSAFKIIAEEHQLQAIAMDEIRDGVKPARPGMALELDMAIQRIAKEWHSKLRAFGLKKK